MDYQIFEDTIFWPVSGEASALLILRDRRGPAGAPRVAQALQPCKVLLILLLNIRLNLQNLKIEVVLNFRLTFKIYSFQLWLHLKEGSTCKKSFEGSSVKGGGGGERHLGDIHFFTHKLIEDHKMFSALALWFMESAHLFSSQLDLLKLGTMLKKVKSSRSAQFCAEDCCIWESLLEKSLKRIGSLSLET